jgi:hypothetical protein
MTSRNTFATGICSILFSIFFFTASAQKNIYIGAKAGLSIPSLKAGDGKNVWNKDYESRLGPDFGLLAELPLSKHFSIQAEVDYVAQGGKRNGIQPMSIPEQYLSAFQLAFGTDQDYLFANLNSVSKINYLQVPIMLKYNLPIAFKKKLSLFAQAGPYFGYMVSAKQTVQTDELHVYTDEEGKDEISPFLVKPVFGATMDTTINSLSELHRFNIGIQGGIGLSYAFGQGKIFIEGGGNYGFLYLQKDDEHGKNNIGAATILLGYALNFKL